MSAFKDAVYNSKYQVRKVLSKADAIRGPVDIEAYVKREMARQMAEMIIHQADFSAVRVEPGGDIEYRMDFCVMKPADMFKAIIYAARDYREQLNYSTLGDNY